MRVEPYSVGSFLHVVKRGARGMSFIEDVHDRNRFLLMLAHFNDTSVHENWYDDLLREGKSSTFERASVWKDKNALTHIHAFCLHENHFHLLLEEILDGGISLFMKKLGTGFVGYINERHKLYGSPFQGSFKAKTIDSDDYLRYVHAYIQVKNSFEQLPRSYAKGTVTFDQAYARAAQLPISSLFDYENPGVDRGIVTKDLFDKIWSRQARRQFAKQVLEGRAHLDERQRRATTGYFI